MTRSVFLFLFIASFTSVFGQEKSQVNDKVIVDANGAIIRGDISEKTLALVFTGHDFGDGGEIIRAVLKNHGVRGAFFLTGDFYRNPAFRSIIRSLKEDRHYLGAHSDKHLLYASWEKRDSLLVTKKEFLADLKDNYKAMAEYGIRKSDAKYFLPPYEWYNKKIAEWTEGYGLRLVNFSPGTLSHADYTYPEMEKRYRDSRVIYESIIDYESKDQHGLNGFILLSHIGTDERRTDKFYNQLDALIKELKSKNYRFVRMDSLLQDP